MALFGLGKKKDETKSSCCCGGTCTPETMEKAEALTELGMDTTIEHIKEWGEIASYGVMTTPALVIDGKIVSFGKVLKKEEVIKILKEVRG